MGLSPELNAAGLLHILERQSTAVTSAGLGILFIVSGSRKLAFCGVDIKKN
jgi:hypothetical protein